MQNEVNPNADAESPPREEPVGNDAIEPVLDLESRRSSSVTPRDAVKIFTPDLMKSISASMPTSNLTSMLSPTTVRFLKEASDISFLLPKTDTIASILSATKGFESISGVTSAASILSSPELTKGIFDSVNVPSISALLGDKFPTSSIVESLGLAPLPRGWLDLLPTQSYINSIIEPIKPFLDVQFLSRELLGGITPGLFRQLDWITQLTKDLKLARSHLPSNWREVNLEPDDLEDEVRAILEEGIPLAWVPSGRVIELLLAAPDAAARRRVITSNHKGLLTSCERLVGRLAAKRALFYVDMMRKAINALRDGHVEAAQSLATNVLDTLVSQHSKDALGVPPGVLTNVSSYKKFKKQSWRLTLAVHPVTTIMSGRFTIDDRPDGYRRNATAHAITRHQYNRINAVLAIMNATSLLTCFVRDTQAFD